MSTGQPIDLSSPNSNLMTVLAWVADGASGNKKGEPQYQKPYGHENDYLLLPLRKLCKQVLKNKIQSVLIVLAFLKLFFFNQIY